MVCLLRGAALCINPGLPSQRYDQPAVGTHHTRTQSCFVFQYTDLAKIVLCVILGFYYKIIAEDNEDYLTSHCDLLSRKYVIYMLLVIYVCTYF